MMQQRLFISRASRAPGLPTQKGCLTFAFETAALLNVINSGKYPGYGLMMNTVSPFFRKLYFSLAAFSMLSGL
jgi:hypothetical protein